MTKKMTMGGETKSIRKWVQEAESGVPLSTVYSRLHRGWSLLESIYKPLDKRRVGNVKQHNEKHYYDGDMLTVREISIRTGYTTSGIRYWLRKGLPIKTKYTNTPPPKWQDLEEKTSAEIQIQNLIASGENYESIAKRIRSGEIV